MKHWLTLLPTAAWFALCVGTGCTGPILRPQSPAANSDEENKSEPFLVGNLAHPYGMKYVKLESVALVTGLSGTGDDPPPSSQRAALLGEMNRRDVEDPNHVLASTNTALVLVRAFLRPGIQAGDRFDVEVKAPTRSNTTSLRGGKLLETRLSETALLGEQIRKGHLMAVAQGAVLVDPSADNDKDSAIARRGRVLGGGVVTKSRNLGLVLDQKHQSIRISQSLGKAINRRFHSYTGGRRQGVATPKNDEFVELLVHPRYKDNVGRFMRVVRNIVIEESAGELLARLKMLDRQLLDPVTSSTAAVRLEAIGGDQAIEILSAGLETEDPEVRFYAAEALAYLDVTEAVAPLVLASREEPAFRANALAALSAMDDGAAYDSLRSLLGVKSAETRYGAFRAIWAMSPNDLLTRGEDMSGMFTYHVLDVPGTPMIHATSSHRPEIVLFGKDHQFKLPLVLDAGPRILINGLSGGKVKVSRFGETTQQRVVSSDVDAVIRAVVELGGAYPDVVQMLQQSKETGALASRFRVNALPETGRELLKSHENKASPEPYDSYEVETPEPDLFGLKN